MEDEKKIIFQHFTTPEGTAQEFYDLYQINPQHLPADRPYTWLMFVMTTDGRTTFAQGGPGRDPYVYAGGSGIAMSHLNTHPLAQGALTDYRALHFGWAYADAIMGTSEIIRVEPEQQWKVDFPDFVNFRMNVLQKKTPQPMKVIITGSGDVDLTQPIFNSKEYRTVIFTAERGAPLLKERMNFAQNHGYHPNLSTSIEVTGENTITDFPLVLRTLKQKYDVHILDVTGGSRLAGTLLHQKLIDEVHLTIAPQIIGDKSPEGKDRPSFVSGLNYDPWNSILEEVLGYGFSYNHSFRRTRIHYRHTV